MELTDSEAKQLAALLIFLHLIVGHQSTAEFVEKPADKWIAVGEVATFRCQHSRADSVGWRINGTSFIPQSLEGVRTDQTSYGSGVVYTLQIYGYASYNRSTIQCEAFFIDSSQRSQLTAAVFLIIQGQLNSVTNIARAPPENITWNPPFTINLSNADPDIVYCVEVHSITCQGKDFYFSEVDCGVTKPFYVNYGLLQGWSYSISITPRSNVEGAQNGSTETKIENFVSLSEPVLLDINRSNVSIRLNYQSTTGAVVPLTFSLLLTSIDGVNNESMIVPALIVDSTNPLFVILTVTLPLSRLWNCRVLPYKCTTAVISSTTQLSTHGLQNISAFSALSGTVNVTGNFINDPAATGAFIIIYSMNGTQTYYLYAKKDPTNKLNAVLSDIPGGNYNISLFVIEEDREIVERAAILPLFISVAVNNQSRTGGTSDEYLKDNITRVLGGIKVECRFLGNNPTTTCVVVIHKQFDQLGPSGLINIRSYVLTRSGDYASKFIEGVDLDTDIVVVTTFPRISSEGYGSITEGIIVAIVVTVGVTAVAVIVIVIVILIVVVVKYQRTSKRKKEQLLVTSPNVSYVPISPSGKQFGQSGSAVPVPSSIRYVDLEKIRKQKETQNDIIKADRYCDKQQSSEDLANKLQQPKTKEGPLAEKVLSSDDGPSCDTLAAAREKPTPPPPFQPKGGHQNIESENHLPSLPIEHGDNTSVSGVQEDVQSVEGEEPQELLPSAASEQQSQDFSVKPDSDENECCESASQVFAGPKGMMFSNVSSNQPTLTVIGTIQNNIDDVNIDVANKPESHGNCDESPKSEIERTEPTEAISAELSEQVVTEGGASSGYPRELPRYHTQRSTNSEGEIEETLIASPSDSIQAEEVSIASGNSEPQCMLATFYSPPPSNEHDAIIK